jgi:hypothetical protein
MAGWIYKCCLELSMGGVQGQLVVEIDHGLTSLCPNPQEARSQRKLPCVNTNQYCVFVNTYDLLQAVV